MQDKPTLLLVDDDTDILDILKNSLEPEGYHCLLASNGNQALVILEQEAVDLVLTDIQMPDMNGTELLTLISVRWPTTVRMVISGKADKDDVINLINLGNIQAYFEKPWDSNKLIRVINSSISAKLFKDAEITAADNYVNKVTNTTPNLILMINHEGIITDWNREAEITFGYQKDEVLGKDMHALLAPEMYKEEYTRGMCHFRDTGEGALIGKTVEVSALKRDGTEFPVELSLNSIKMNNSWHAMGILRDITERKQAESDREEDLLHYKESLISTIRAIALTVEKRDPYTAGHQDRVAQLSTAIAGKLDLSIEQILGIEMGAIIHDIGKVYIPSEILSRPGKLTDHEFGMIKSHPQVGYDIIKDINFPWPVAEMIRQHHERFNGSGYPNGLKGDEIIVEAQIIAVADVVEAISSHRPYRPSLGMDIGIEEIQKNKGDQYNPDVVDACVKLIREENFEFTSIH